MTAPTTPDPFATSSDVRDVGVEFEDAAQVDKLCAYASALIRADFPDIDERITDNKLNPLIVQWVCISMVRRAIESPEDGATQSSETIGEWSHSGTFTQGKGLYIKADEADRLGGRDGSGGAAFTITPASNTANTYMPPWDRS